jgi:N utilization substance protein A
MAITEFNAALNQVATERGIPVSAVIDSIKLALVSAYRKDRKEHGEEIEEEQEIEVELDPDTGEAKIMIEGEDVTPSGFGRIAAQTAKQVILQKIRETEKEVILQEFRAKLGTVITSTVFKVDTNVVIVDLGKQFAYGIMPISEQVQSEEYRMNQRLKILIKDIRESNRGPEIIVSRSDPKFIEELFAQEVPEIASGVVKIEAIAREPGSRTKMAVSSSDEKIDPVGSCVGQKGVRVQSIIAELYGEKIDIIPYSTTTERFIAAALSPAMVTDVELDEENKRAIVSVPEDQQSLAIGKEGQNARLANKLTKWKIDIKGAAGIFGSQEEKEGEDDEKTVRGIWDEAIKEKKSQREEESSTESDELEEDKENEDEVEEEKEAEEEEKDEDKEKAEEKEKPEDEVEEEKEDSKAD